MKRSLILCVLLGSFILCPAQKTENVFLITLDGLRWQELFTGADSLLIGHSDYVRNADGLRERFWAATPQQRREKLMPFFWSTIAEGGQIYGNRIYENKVNCSNQMWFSYPGYNEILCGFADDERITSNDKIDNPNTTVLEHLHKMESFKGKVAAFGSWDVFPYIINEDRSGIPVNAGFESAVGDRLTSKQQFLNQLQKEIPSPWGTVRLDAFTHHFAWEYLQQNKPRVVYIAYGETDDFAHDGDYQAYLKSAHQTDEFIKQLWEWAQSDPQYRDKTTFLITTDHGRGTIPLDTWKSHGTKIEGADEIWIAVLGPDISALGEVKDQQQHYQDQVAATLAKLLQVEYKEGKIAPPISTVFD